MKYVTLLLISLLYQFSYSKDFIILQSTTSTRDSGFYNHLIPGGFIILSGILRTQKNDLINHFGKFNLKLVKNIYINEWESLILKKNE